MFQKHGLVFQQRLFVCFVSHCVSVAEYIVTSFTGILFWTLFAQTKKGEYDGPDSILLKINKNIIGKSVKTTTNLLKYQKDSIKHVFSNEKLGAKISDGFGDFISRTFLVNSIINSSEYFFDEFSFLERVLLVKININIDIAIMATGLPILL